MNSIHGLWKPPSTKRGRHPIPKPQEKTRKKSRNAKHFLVSMEVLLATCDTFLGCDEPCTLIQGCLFGQVYFLKSIPVRCHCHPLSSFLSRDQTSTQRPTSVEYPSVDVPLRSENSRLGRKPFWMMGTKIFTILFTR